MLPTFMEVLDTAIASVALPYIAGSLSASNSEATWVLTSYLVANAVILPASNWFARRFGRKRFLLICVIIFTVASFFCGAAPSLGVILLARVMQGAGGGALQPLSQSILLESFPVQKRSMSMAAYGLGIVMAPVIGPTLGGWLTDTFSWRYAFYINIPVGILAVILISRFVHDPPYIKNAKVGPFDNIGFGLLMVWTGSLQIVLDKGQEDDWFGAAGCAGRWPRWWSSLVLWIWHSWTHPKGLVDLHVLKDRNFRTGCFLIAMLGMCIYITIAILPLYYQEVLGYTAFTAGLVVGPRGIGSFIGSPVIGILGSRIDNASCSAPAFSALASARSSSAPGQPRHRPLHAADSHHPDRLCPELCLCPHVHHDDGHHSPQEMGNATGLFNMLRNIGGSIGISMATTALIRRAALHQTELGAQLGPSNLSCSRSRAIAGYLGHHIGPAAGPPRLLGPDLRPDGAAIGADGLCGCLPLDGAAGLLLRRRRVALQEALILVVFNFGIVCGDDSVLLGYEWKGEKWTRVLRWQSDPDRTPNAFGDFFEYRVLQQENSANWLIGVAHGHPMCTSNFGGFDLDIIQPKRSDSPQKVLLHKQEIYWRDDPVKMKLTSDGLELRVSAYSRDINIIRRTGIYRYRISADQIDRVQPIAINGRDFVDEWLNSPWNESKNWNSPSELAGLESTHKKIETLNHPADQNQETPNLTYGPVRHCSDSASHFQVELDKGWWVEEKNDWRPDTPTFFQIQEGKNSFTMLSASNKPDPRCTGHDIMPKQ
jgi:DHA2 family multidrug resistance protein